MERSILIIAVSFILISQSVIIFLGLFEIVLDVGKFSLLMRKIIKWGVADLKLFLLKG